MSVVAADNQARIAELLRANAGDQGMRALSTTDLQSVAEAISAETGAPSAESLAQVRQVRDSLLWQAGAKLGEIGNVLLVTVPGENRVLEEPEELVDATSAEKHSDALVAIMKANAHVPMHASHLLAPRMRATGQMLHVAPAAGPTGSPGGGGPALRMAKSALLAGSKTIRATAPFTVRAVCPAQPGDLDMATILWLVAAHDVPEGSHAFCAKQSIDAGEPA